jgi:GNAT superfamily N-acetyltransferase
MSEIRLLNPADLPALTQLSLEAQWNQTGQDWLRLMDLAPASCFGIESGGRIVASTTVLCYGRDLAWIGMVLTHSEHRGNNYASRLMRHALHWAENERIGCVKLDATQMGQPIYEKLGFQFEREVERWARPAHPVPVDRVPKDSGEFAYPRALDVAAFGADRRMLLYALALHDAIAIPGEGYAMSRPGALARYLGPCVARSSVTARELVESVVSRYCEERIYWDLFPGNAEAVSIARENGFAPVRRLARMALVRESQPDLPPLTTADDPSIVYGIGAFEYG